VRRRKARGPATAETVNGPPISQAGEFETIAAAAAEVMRRQHQVIPNPLTADDALAVTNGAMTIGYIIERDGSHFAFDQDGVPARGVLDPSRGGTLDPGGADMTNYVDPRPASKIGRLRIALMYEEHRRDGALDTTGTLIGIFDGMRVAMRALPDREVSSC
jgi:hypothetical protein